MKVRQRDFSLANTRQICILSWQRYSSMMLQCACVPSEIARWPSWEFKQKREEMLGIPMRIIFMERRLCILRTRTSLTPPISASFVKRKQIKLKTVPPAVISCRAGRWRPVFVEVECAKLSPKDTRDHRRVHHCAASHGRKSLGEGGWSQSVSLEKQ